MNSSGKSAVKDDKKDADFEALFDDGKKKKKRKDNPVMLNEAEQTEAVILVEEKQKL